jgi:hypothetical protein
MADSPAQITQLSDTAGGTLSPIKYVRVDTGADSISVKTPENNNNGTTLDDTILANWSKAKYPNILNSYRSYTYIITLSSLPKDAVDPKKVYDFKKDQRNFIIVRSGGKGSEGLLNYKDDSPGSHPLVEAPNTPNANIVQQVGQERNRLIASFNLHSPGKFDFYINNIIIDNIVGGSQKSSMAPATRLEFTVTEPYSMNGFIEALQVSSMAAGNDGYINSPFLFKIEFFGYPDIEDITEPSLIESATRYIPFSFTGLDINVDESGSHYTCKAIPYNERAFSEPNQLQDDFKIAGSTVREILSNLEKNLNDSAKETAKQIYKDESKHDEYEIIIPYVDETSHKIDYEFSNKQIGDSTVTALWKSSTAYSFANPETIQNAGERETIRYDPTESTVSFAKGHDVLDCISSIVRDSDYVADLLRTSKKDDYGLIDYFMVNAEAVPLDRYDEKGNKPFFKYTFMVLPYKMHYARVIPRAPGVVDTSKLKTKIHKEYNYLYTGKNIDIKNFRLQFNTLFFQAIPKYLGNKITLPFNSKTVEGDNPVISQLKSNPNLEVDAINKWFPLSPTKITVESGMIHFNGTPNAKEPQIDPYVELAKNVHQAILENQDQCSLEIEIIGDPYYVITDGMGNQRLKLNSDGTIGDGEASTRLGDVHILVQFKNPLDINTRTGEEEFQAVINPVTGLSESVTLYSGVFRVIQCSSTFKDGEFLQNLKLIRIPNQVEDSNTQPTDQSADTPVASIPDPTRANTPPPAAAPVTVRASGKSLAESIAAGAPITGLPGEASNLVPGAEGSLAGNQSSGNVLDLNQIAAATESGAVITRVSGLPSNAFISVGSTIRLVNSGLINLTNNATYEVSGAVYQLSSVARSIGIKTANAQKVARLMQKLGAKKPAQLISNVISKVNNLESKAAGLISNVSSKIAEVNGKVGALERELGVISNTISGLGGALENKLLNKLGQLANKIPAEVDLNSAIRKGLLIKDIPQSSFPNIPPTQPDTTAPEPALSPADLQSEIDRGSDLSYLSGQVTMPDILSSLPEDPLPDPSTPSVTGKLLSMQSGMNDLIGLSPSVESNLNNVSDLTGDNVPNFADVSLSVVNQYGSNSEGNISPLKALMKSRLI